MNSPIERQTGWTRQPPQFSEAGRASLALAGVTACTKQPKEVIVPYVRQPEEFVPGIPLYFATAMQMGGVGTALLVTSHLGRPTKVEGNPDHLGNLGASDISNRYRPDDVRSGSIKGRDEGDFYRFLVWFQGAVAERREEAAVKNGNGLRISPRR